MIKTSDDQMCTHHVSTCRDVEMYISLTDVRKKRGVCPPQARTRDLHAVIADKTRCHPDGAETQPAEDHDAQHGH